MEVPGLADLASPWQPWVHPLPAHTEPRSFCRSPGAHGPGEPGFSYSSSPAIGTFESLGGQSTYGTRFQCERLPKFLEDDTTGASSSSERSTRPSSGGDLPQQVEVRGATTVMMRNIPSEFTGATLLTLLNRHGFKGSYDLVYLPMDYNNKVGFGYAFINFVDSSWAKTFRGAFEGFTDWGLVSDKVCEVCWSNVLQGVAAHIERYRNSPVMHPMVPETFKPMLFVEGEKVPFPAPTKTIRPPRLRKKQQ
ncbi:Meiosis protein mei2 [Durusdinium trenchii]|uniref:Meiosis protein mei2 n=1 Tax=Durusdinium trenchii TaxID=1381693 RepID=A0ABP0RXB3_9DINO